MTNNDSQRDQARRLRDARARRFKTVKDAWREVRRRIDISLSAYTQHENGTRGYKIHASIYADIFDTSLDWLLTGKRSESHRVEVPLKGKIGAGTEGYFLSDYAEGSEDTILFEREDVTCALKVEGDSMKPRYLNGDEVIFGFRYDDPTQWIGHDVMAQLTDGRKLLKRLQKGSKAGVWKLISHNSEYDPIYDVELDWVMPVKWIKV